MSISIDLTGDLNVIKAKLATLPEKMLDYAQQVLSTQCDLIVGIAKVEVLVETGALRDSIRKERGGEGLRWRQYKVRAGGYVVNPKTGRLVDYAGHVEHKYPFLRFAVDQVKPTIEMMLNSGMVEAVE